ncbi:hypothetical protein CRYUN_Cryun06bG0069300 [Craigia yunnanensis]
MESLALHSSTPPLPQPLPSHFPPALPSTSAINPSLNYPNHPFSPPLHSPRPPTSSQTSLVFPTSQTTQAPPFPYPRHFSKRQHPTLGNDIPISTPSSSRSQTPSFLYLNFHRPHCSFLRSQTRRSNPTSLATPRHLFIHNRRSRLKPLTRRGMGIFRPHNFHRHQNAAIYDRLQCLHQRALIAPAMPSTTARAGGVFLPIIKSLSVCWESAWGFVISEAWELSNSIAVSEELGIIISSHWVWWFKAASLPALVSLLLTPLILYKLYPPRTKDTPDAPEMAAKKLELMGPVSRNEWIMVGTMLLAVTLWVRRETLGIPSVVAAMIGQLTNLGIVSWMSGCVSKILQSLSLSWPATFGVLQAFYFFIHYLFGSQTGYVGALYSAFLAMHLAAGVPGVLAAVALAYNTNLFGALTHYSSGQAAVYYGAGYVDLPDVFEMGFVMAFVNAILLELSGGNYPECHFSPL